MATKSGTKPSWAAKSRDNPVYGHCAMLARPVQKLRDYKTSASSWLPQIFISFIITLSTVMDSSFALATAQSIGLPGFDVSNHQPYVDYRAAYAKGAQFVIIKVCQTSESHSCSPCSFLHRSSHISSHPILYETMALLTQLLTSTMQSSEGSEFADPVFQKHFQDATDAGLIRGAYHFALPSTSTGAMQATHFLNNGGRWTPDGITLPGMLDLEYDPAAKDGEGDVCYGLSHDEMVSWIKDFVITYYRETRRAPMVYTTADWWKSCTADSTVVSKVSALVLARYDDKIGEIPGGWTHASIWQYNDKFPLGGCSDVFTGNYRQLRELARGKSYDA